MSLVRSRRVFGPTSLTADALTDLYTVPDGRTLIIRTMLVYNTSGVTVGVYVVINGVSCHVQDVLHYTTADILHHLVLNPGDELAGYAQGGELFVTVAGSLLEGAPT